MAPCWTQSQPDPRIQRRAAFRYNERHRALSLQQTTFRKSSRQPVFNAARLARTLLFLDPIDEAVRFSRLL